MKEEKKVTLFVYQEPRQDLMVVAAVSGGFQRLEVSRTRKTRDMVYGLLQTLAEMGYTLAEVPTPFSSIFTTKIKLLPASSTTDDYKTARDVAKIRFQREMSAAERIFDGASKGKCKFCEQLIYWHKDGSRWKAVDPTGTAHIMTCSAKLKLYKYMQWRHNTRIKRMQENADHMQLMITMAPKT